MASPNPEMDECHLSLDELRKWKVADLKKWLERHGLKRSGNKAILVNRVNKALRNCEELDESFSSDVAEECEIPIPKLSELSDNWQSADNSNIPTIEEKNIDNYFLFQKNPASGRKLKFERHLVKAKRMCNEGFIRDISFHAISKDSEHCYFRAKCMPSMRSSVNVGNNGNVSSFYTLHSCVVKSTGKINHSYCDCKAGMAGLCAHVGALLFSFSKIKRSCTSTGCCWNRPRPMKSKPSPKRIYDINFSRTEKDSVSKTKPYPGVYKASQCQDPDVFLNELLNGLETIYPECVLYQTLRPKAVNIDDFTQNFRTDFMFHDNVDLNSEHCRQTFETFLQEIKISDSVCCDLEIATKGQHINQNWTVARGFLLTASDFGDICKRQKSEPDGLLKRVCGYTEIPAHVKSLCHGRKYESKAVKCYTTVHKQKCGIKNVDIQQKGLCVNAKFPFLGASVDGYVTCTLCGPGVVEIKCPYGKKKHRTGKI